MRTIFILALILAALTQVSCKNEIPSVVILPMELGNGANKFNAAKVASAFLEKFTDGDALIVVDSVLAAKIYANPEFRSLDWSDERKTTMIKEATKADMVVQGYVPNDDFYTFTLYDLNRFGYSYTKEAYTGNNGYHYLADLFSDLKYTIRYQMKDKSKKKEYNFYYLGEGNKFRWTTQSSGRNNYNLLIGQKGPSGGIIFFDKGNNSDGWRFLEAASKETEYRAQWGGFGKKIGNVPGIERKELGFGKYNTMQIINHLGRNGQSKYAARKADGIAEMGYWDWYLPTLDELFYMYENLYKKGIGGFEVDKYWTSFQLNYNSDSAQAFDFRDGSNYPHSTDNTFLCRAIRAFSDEALPEYKIGDKGPAGGIVFYDRGEYTSAGNWRRWRYLEAAPVETEYEAEWATAGTDVFVDSKIEFGYDNTFYLTDYLNSIGVKGKAAQVAYYMNYNGFADWFLPTKDELLLLYEYLYTNNIDDVANKVYWSSSNEFQNKSFAIYVHSYGGPTYNYGKLKDKHTCRAIRRF